jgi:hypothetical protein
MDEGTPSLLSLLSSLSRLFLGLGLRENVWVLVDLWSNRNCSLSYISLFWKHWCNFMAYPCYFEFHHLVRLKPVSPRLKPVKLAKANLSPEITGIGHQFSFLFSFLAIAFNPLACMLIYCDIFLMLIHMCFSSQGVSFCWSLSCPPQGGLGCSCGRCRQEATVGGNKEEGLVCQCRWPQETIKPRITWVPPSEVLPHA